MRAAARARRKLTLMLIVAVVATGLSLAAYATNALRRPELSTVDLRFAVRGRAHPPRDIVVVQVDDATFGYLNRRWPFPRRFHARVIDRLHAAGARVIGYDVQFTEQTDPADDNALISSVEAARPMVLATTETDTHGRSNVFGGVQAQRQVGARVGSALLAPDPDAIYRRVPFSVNGLRSFAVVLAEAASKRSVAAGRFGDGSVPIDFAGPQGTIPTISMSRVLQGHFPPNLFRGKIVIVGPSAPSLQDVHATPYGHDVLMSGAELQANAVATVLRGLPLNDVQGWVDVLLIIALGFFTPLVSLRVSSGRALLLAVGLAAVFTVGVQLAFNAGSIVSLTYPLMGLALATFGTLGVSYMLEAFERARVRTLFGRFVPEDVVDQVLARTDDNLRLGAVERVCTVLFCDLRGFTSFSETQPAQRTLDVVNFYLNVMTEAILEAGGTLISYMGDGIMAVFGAPLEQPDHAARALAASREMMGPRLDQFNAWLGEQGFDSAFRMGIGLNTGPVMAGNIGSEQRVEYTAIGDTTNTASRLEGMTKGTPYMLFLSDATRDGISPAPDDLVFVDEFEVRGRKAKLKVWAVADPGG